MTVQPPTHVEVTMKFTLIAAAIVLATIAPVFAFI